MTLLTRRNLALAGGATLLVGTGTAFFGPRSRAAGGSTRRTFEVNLTDDEWKKLLTPAQYGTLRKGQTEPRYTSTLNNENRTGRYVCAGCRSELFSSATKFESGTGWPAFWRALPNATTELTETAHPFYGTEVLCAKCGGHLGHVFADGPKPTGLRYCMNGVALAFNAGNA